MAEPLQPFLLDASVMMGAFMPFRERHVRCCAMLSQSTQRKARCYIPSHAYFEYTRALLSYATKEPEKLRSCVTPTYPDFEFSVISLTQQLVEELPATLVDGEIPYLKSQDLIYSGLARYKSMNFVTEDRKLHHASRRAGINAMFIDEAFSFLEQP